MCSKSSEARRRHTLGIGAALLTAAVAAALLARTFALAGAAHQPDLEKSASKLTLRERLAGPCVGAHRGGSTAADSNTIPRFQKALEAGVDIVEMDLRLTADGIPIVFHDEGVGRGLFREKLEIARSTLAEIRKHKVAGTEEIPTFAQVLQWANGRVVINAEFKERDVVGPAVRLVREYDAYEWVYFQTKSDPGRYLLARQEDKRVALLFKPETQEELDWILGLDDNRIVVIEFHAPMRTKENLRRVHKAGKLASENSWHFTPFKETFGAACKRAWDAGMDIAITKHPAHGVRQRAAYETRHQGDSS